MIHNWDYLSIGTIGFAQVGSPQYENRVVVEKMVISGFFETDDRYKVPEEFQFSARFSWELCPHDFGSYWDFKLEYDRWMIEELEESHYGDDREQYERFMKWADDCQSALGKNEEILNKWCNQLYQKEITMEIVHKRIEEYGLKQA